MSDPDPDPRAAALAELRALRAHLPTLPLRLRLDAALAALSDGDD